MDGQYLSNLFESGTWILDSCSSTNYALCQTSIVIFAIQISFVFYFQIYTDFSYHLLSIFMMKSC
jgi:hypothetical protein